MTRLAALLALPVLLCVSAALGVEYPDPEERYRAAIDAFLASETESAPPADAIVAAIHDRLPQTRIYVLSVKPSTARWKLWEVMRETNVRLAERAAADARLTFIDIATPMLNDAGEPREDIFVDDKPHMNDAGYDIWRDAVRPVLVEAEGGFEP